MKEHQKDLLALVQPMIEDFEKSWLNIADVELNLNRVTIYPQRAKVMLPYEYCFVGSVRLSVQDIQSEILLCLPSSGVDPLLSHLENKKVIEIFDMPTMIDGKKNKRQINGSQVTNLIKERLNDDKEIIDVVEHVNAMPGQGVTSMFNFGQSFGVIKGICSALSLPIYFVRPTIWIKHFYLI